MKFNPEIELVGEIGMDDKKVVSKRYIANTICVLRILKATISSFLKHKFISSKTFNKFMLSDFIRHEEVNN